jgi:hypothetical protein
MKKNLSEFIESPKKIKEALDFHKKNYRKLDPGWYLYRELMRKQKLDQRIAKDRAELMYVTLCAWNMNSRAARLSELNMFFDSLRKFGSTIKRLKQFDITTISKENYSQILKKDIKDFFDNAILVADGKPKLITYSKTLHFLCPKLFAPIDRKYTLAYFGSTIPKDSYKSFALFCNIQEEFRAFSQSTNLSKYLDDSWNQSSPKIIDNMIIGHTLLVESKKFI